jgi:hypothetical protein
VRHRDIVLPVAAGGVGFDQPLGYGEARLVGFHGFGQIAPGPEDLADGLVDPCKLGLPIQVLGGGRREMFHKGERCRIGFERLCRMALPRQDITHFVVDDRCLPPRSRVGGLPWRLRHREARLIESQRLRQFVLPH